MKPTKVTKQSNGTMDIEFSDGTKGSLSAEDGTMQAFVIFKILQGVSDERTQKSGV